MSMQDLEADLTRCKQMQEAAAKCYWESKFDQSEELYRATLAVLETVYATDSSNIATCLQGLGDSYYFQDKFGLALPYYKRLFASRERMVDTDATEYVTALFKLAKTYDKLGEFEEAEFHYKKAAAAAQKRLFLGHPLLTSLLEAYGKFLKRVKPGTEHAIEQQATLSREKYVDPEMLAANILEGVGGEKSDQPTSDTGVKKSRIWFSKSISEDSDHWLVKLLMLVKGNPAKTYMVLLSPIMLAFAVFFVCVVYELIVDDAPQNAMVVPGQVFQTVDGHQSVAFSKDDAEVKHGDQVARKKYLMLNNRWRELAFTLNNSNSEPWTVKTNEGLISASGASLINATSPVTKMVPIMAKVSEQVYEKLNNKPNNIAQPRAIKLDPYSDPYDGFYTHPLSVLVNLRGRESADVEQEVIRRRIENALRLDEIALRLTSIPTIPSSLKDGSVLCILVDDRSKPDDIRFYVLGVGKNGVLVTGCKRGAPLLFYGGKGIPSSMNCDGQNVSAESRLIIARRSKDALVEARKLLGWDLLLLLPFVIATIMLQDQFNAKKVSERGLHSRISLMQMAVSIYLPFALMYLGFTIYAIYRALTDGS